MLLILNAVYFVSLKSTPCPASGWLSCLISTDCSVNWNKMTRIRFGGRFYPESIPYKKNQKKNDYSSVLLVYFLSTKNWKAYFQSTFYILLKNILFVLLRNILKITLKCT